MKTLLHKFLSLSLIATVLASTLTPSLTNQTANAAEPGASFFTPNRPSIEFRNNEEGLPYPSFNNFFFPANYRDANGNSVIQEQRGGDERKFTLARLCPEGDCEAVAPAYLNTVSDAAEAGDKIRFEVYFHNNGEDPHDGDNLTSPDARNVEIGIDLSALVVDANNIVRPRGFIKADNNEYRTDRNNPATTIRDQNGNPIRRATDDISLKLADPDLKLKPILSSASVFMNTGEGANRAEVTDIRGPNTDLTITTANGTEVDVNARVTTSGDKLWITFDRLPGCFDYSGLAYFDVQIVEEEQPTQNVCEALSAIVFGGPREMPNGKIAYPLTITEARFSDVIPQQSRILWQSPEDPNGEFYTSSIVNGQRVFNMISNSGTTVTNFTNGQVIFYAGDGPVTVTSANLPDNIARPDICHAEVDIPLPPEEPVFCTDLNISGYQRTLLAATGQTQHRFIINGPTFSDGEIPANTEIQLTTNNDNGAFKVFSTSVFPPRFVNLEESAENTVERIATEQAQIFLYINDGSTADRISARIIPVGLDRAACRANLTTEITPVAPVCREIRVSYQDPIYEGTETLFRAESFDSEGNPFNDGRIRYSVDNGHGTFSNRENPAVLNNPSPRREHRSPFEEGDDGGANGGVNAPVPQFELPGILENIREFDFPGDDQEFEIPARPAQQADRPILNIRQNQNPFENVVIPQAVADFGLNLPIAPNLAPQRDDLLERGIDRRNIFNSVLSADAAEINDNSSLINGNLFRLDNGPAQNGQSVTVDANEDAYLSATRAGVNVVHVDQLDEEGNVIEQCSADFSIIGVRCQNLTYEIDGEQEPRTIDRNEVHVIRAAARFSGVPDPTDNEITYKIDARYGAFIENPAAAAALSNVAEKTKANVEAALRAANIDPAATLKAEVTRDSSPESFHFVMYADAPEAGGSIIEIVSTKDGQNCKAVVQVLPDTPDQAICIDTEYDLTRLKFVSPIVALSREAANKVERAGMYEIKAKSNFANEAALPSGQNKLRISIPAEYGAIINPANSVSGNEFALRNIAALQQGSSFTAETFRAFAAQLTNGADLIQQTVLVDPNQPLIIVTYSNAPNAANVIKIEQVGFEQTCKAEVPIAENRELICTELKFDGSFDPKNRLTEMKIRVNEFPKTGIKVTSNGECKLSKQAAPSTLYDELNFVKGENLTFYIICESYNPQTDTVEITADGGANCKQQIKIPPVPVQPEICTDLDITTPDEPWDIDEDDDRQNFEIAVQTNPSNLKDNFYYHFEVTDGDGTWADNDRKTVSARGDLTQTLEDFDEDTRVTVYASSDANGQNTFAACRDTIRPRLDRDTPPRDREEKPEIEKVVYPENEIDDADDLINIAGKERMPYVTYMAIFTPGSETKSVAIQENSIKNGAIKGNQGGSLNFQGLEIIAVEDFSDEEGEVLYRSNGYKKDSSRDRAGDNNYDYDDDEDYDCDERGSRICIEEIEEIEENFRAGDEIRFDNVDKLKPDGRIIIKYQMKNNSVIDERECQKLSKSSGCGEKFNNTIEYTSYERTEWEDREDTGNDDADVFVICPYILARQGGDALMYKGFDLGIDIAACSPVKGSDGIGIEIIPEDKPRIPSTGTDENGNPLLLDLPSHDVCRYSNTEDNIESYKNALENFSSTVCELEAKVAEELYDTNINKAINANIGRIARFGENLTIGKTLSSVGQLNGLDNAQSGVFIKTSGDLTIDGGSNGFKIEKTNSVRAAQTYIVRGHDLIINSDIIYGSTNYTDPRNIPAVAFIVIDGNIIIDKDVKRLDGIYMAVNLSQKDGLGEINSNEESETLLTINGSLIGNVYKLFRDRIGVGDPRKDQGAVTIKYDERILLNTPPGIGELVDIKQAIVP